MRNLIQIKNFRKVESPLNRQPTEEEIEIGAFYLVSDDGQDWYECQELFSDDTVKIAYDSAGLIWQIVAEPIPQRGNVYAVSMLWPVDMSVAEIAVEDFPQDCQPDGTWQYTNGKVEKSAVSYMTMAETERNKLLSEASEITADWMTDLQLGIISDEDKAALILWRTYIKSVKELDLSAVTDEESYNGIVWPVKPE